MRRAGYIPRLLILGLSGPLIALNLWILSQVFRYFEHLITVLALAAILAFLLNYCVRSLERFPLSRTQAVTIVLLVTLTLLIVLGVTLVPILTNQLTQLLDNLPNLLETSSQNLDRLYAWGKARRLPLDLQEFTNQLSNRIETYTETLASQALGLALGTLTGLLNVILVVVLAFYMLLYGEQMWLGIVNLLPPHIGLPLSESLRLNFQKFFISQLLLGLFMFAMLTPVFLALKAPFALLFALLIGASQLIPIIGAAMGIGLVTLLIMLQDFWLAVQVAIAAVFLQQIKDNLLAPKLMSDFIGLNPLWIFITLLIGAQMAGLLGVIVAVPIAGTIKGTLEAIRRQRQPPVVTTEVISLNTPPPSPPPKRRIPD
ncbi:MAG: AI-2E family transporter [Kastovskya adunca ATA6-11-RM4]|jgi:predicted PurR-regulated permease PerM|nr:AI-2E family transporter [Kastovskya adunca ATA6-11-RM4]